MTLAEHKRPGATLPVGLCWYALQCQTRIQYKLTRQVLRWHSIGWLPIKSMMQSKRPWRWGINLEEALPTIIVRRRSNYCRKRVVSCQSSSFVCHTIWHDVVWWMAWFISWASCFETTLHEHDNLLGCVACYYWAHDCFMTWPRWRYHELCSHSAEVWAYKPSKATIKRWHCSGNEKNELDQQSTVNIQNTEDDVKILLRILSMDHLQLLPLLLFTYVTMLCMPGHRFTQSEYTLQQVVEQFGNLLFSLEDHCLTHT